jgi:hypothetical protein
MRFFARWFTTLLLAFTLTTLVTAQELWGIANSNYAGTMGLDLNPASLVAAPYKWEIHLLSTDISAMNNYLYLQKNSRAIRTFASGGTLSEDRLTYKNITVDKFANVQAFAKLPAFLYSRPKWGIAFHVSSRVALGARGVPYHLANFMKEGFDFKAQQKIDYRGGNSKVAGMNWHEAGICVGAALIRNESNFLAAGLTLNYLYGLNSFYLLLDDINYNVQADTLWQIYLAKLEYGHAILDPNNPSSAGAFAKKGSGIGGSIGFQYYRNKKEVNPCDKGKFKKYDFKIGFSLIDIGRIKYNTAASKFEFNNVSTDWYGIDTVKIKGVQTTDVTFNNQFLGNATAGQTGTSYALWLPAAASLQIDYSITPSWYINLSMIQRLPLNIYTVRRANQMALTLRYERKRFEIAVPYNFYDYFRHRVGLCLRYQIFTIGTDMIGPYTGITDAYGFSFYFGIKYQHFPKCKNKSARPLKRNYTNDCYQELKK